MPQPPTRNDLPQLPKKLPTYILWVQYPTKKGMAKARYLVTFRPTSAKISFKDKSLQNSPVRHIPRHGIIVDPYVSKEQFVMFVKEYFGEKADCHPISVILRWEKWFPLWGEPWQ